MTRLTRFAVAPLHTMTRRLADVASGRLSPDLVVTGARILSTYSERILKGKEVWITGGRIAAVKGAGGRIALTLSDPFCVGRFRDEFLHLLDKDVSILFANEEEAKALFAVDTFDAVIPEISLPTNSHRNEGAIAMKM